jgi:glutathione S-transferase
MAEPHILYSYRRCPYAMRARMALTKAGVGFTIREISLREKPSSMLKLSPKATVPVLVLENATVIDESLDIVYWALNENDPDGWLVIDSDTMQSLIAENDGSFKQALDRYKYPDRFPDLPAGDYRAEGEVFLQKLETHLTSSQYLLRETISVVDIAIFPFIRQFANVDKAWFEASPYPKLRVWLASLIESALFEQIMQKQPTYVD